MSRERALDSRNDSCGGGRRQADYFRKTRVVVHHDCSEFRQVQTSRRLHAAMADLESVLRLVAPNAELSSERISHTMLRAAQFRC